MTNNIHYFLVIGFVLLIAFSFTAGSIANHMIEPETTYSDKDILEMNELFELQAKYLATCNGLNFERCTLIEARICEGTQNLTQYRAVDCVLEVI